MKELLKYSIGASAAGIGVLEMRRSYRYEKQYLEFGSLLEKNYERAKFFAFENEKLPIYWLDRERTIFFNYWRYERIKYNQEQALKDWNRTDGNAGVEHKKLFAEVEKAVGSAKWKSLDKKQRWKEVQDAITVRGIQTYFLRALSASEIEEITCELQRLADLNLEMKSRVAARLQKSYNNFMESALEGIIAEDLSPFRDAQEELNSGMKEADGIVGGLILKYEKYNPVAADELRKKRAEISDAKTKISMRINALKNKYKKNVSDRNLQIYKNAEKMIANANQPSDAEKELADVIERQEISYGQVKDAILSVGNAFGSGFAIAEVNELGGYGNGLAVLKGDAIKTSLAEMGSYAVSKEDVLRNFGKLPQITATIQERYDFGIYTATKTHHQRYILNEEQYESFFNSEIPQPIVEWKAYGGEIKSAFANAAIPIDSLRKAKDIYGKQIISYNGQLDGVMTMGIATASKSYSDSKISLESGIADARRQLEAAKKERIEWAAGMLPQDAVEKYANASKFASDSMAQIKSLKTEYRNAVEAEMLQRLDAMGVLDLKNGIEASLEKAKQMGRDIAKECSEKVLEIVKKQLGEEAAKKINDVYSMYSSYGKEAVMFLQHGFGMLRDTWKDVKNIAKIMDGDYLACYKGIDGFYEKWLSAGTIAGTILRSIPYVGQVLMVYDALRKIPGFEHLAAGAIEGAANSVKDSLSSGLDILRAFKSGDVLKMGREILDVPLDMLASQIENLRTMLESFEKFFESLFDADRWKEIGKAAYNYAKDLGSDALGSMGYAMDELKRGNLFFAAFGAADFIAKRVYDTKSYLRMSFEY